MPSDDNYLSMSQKKSNFSKKNSSYSINEDNYFHSDLVSEKREEIYAIIRKRQRQAAVMSLGSNKESKASISGT